MTSSELIGENQQQMNLKRKTLLGPWKNIAEFHKVYDWLFADNANNESHHSAIKQMRIWHLRRGVLCPAAVSATIVILEVQLKDLEENINPKDLQILYSSAFTRFFNYMSSIMQTHNLRSMYETARRLGLQSFVVDLRHICAHGQVMPPLEVLRNTANYCFHWLNDYYWRTQRTIMQDVDAQHIRHKDKTQFDESVTELFCIYDTALECYMKGAQTLKQAKRHLHGKRFALLKQYQEEHNIEGIREVFDAIVIDLETLVKREASIKDLPEIYIEALMKMKYFYTVAELCSAFDKLETIIEATQSLFRMLAISGFIEDYLYKLFETMENNIYDDVRRSGASFWATQVVAGFVAFRRCKQICKADFDLNPNMMDLDLSTLNLEKMSKQSRKILIYAGINVKRTLIFGDSLRRPWVWIFERSFLEEHLENVNTYTAPVLKSLMPLIEPALTVSEIKLFAELLDTFFATNIASPENSITEAQNANKIYTASDVLKRVYKCTTQSMDIDNDLADKENTQFGIWSIFTDDETHDWTTCPLGRLPWE